MIILDGSYLEGGGQIVRTALGLSVLTKKPFEVNNIRANRPDKGLKNQHLYCIRALKELCNADVEGDELGSSRIKFTPHEIKTKDIIIDIGTAGSITLVLQSLLIPCVFSDKAIKLKIKGGTDVLWSPSMDYLKEVILFYLRKIANIEIKIIRRGFYPKGNGEIEIKIKHRQKPKFELTEQWNLMQIKGVSHASLELQKANVAERQAEAAKLMLKALGAPIDIISEYSETFSTGSVITLWAIFSKDKDDINENNTIRLGSDCIGEKGKRAEDVGREAAEKLAMEIKNKAAADSHICDNLIPYLGILGGRIKTSEITQHTMTNIYVAEQFLNVKFKIDKENKIIEN